MEREQKGKVNMNEQTIVQTAIEKLRENLNIRATWTPEKEDVPTFSPDGLIKLHIEGRTIALYAAIKNEVRNHHLEYIRVLAHQYFPLILVANTISPSVKEQLRHNKIAYLETSGNIYVEQDGIFLWIEGNKPVVKHKTHTNRAFTRTGLKVVFQFLWNEATLNLPYREIASLCRISLGNVGNIIDGLKKAGFIVEYSNNRYQLINKAELFEHWVTGYAERLQPTLEIGTFRFGHRDNEQWKNISLHTTITLWGGEPAGALLTGYLKPSIFTLYTQESRAELIKNYRLLPDPQGNIRAYTMFWHHEPNGNTVPPLLTYTDLINSNDPRCIDTAERIYHEYLENKLRDTQKSAYPLL